MNAAENSQPACPTGITGAGEHVTLVHGEGGRMMRQLIQQRILRAMEIQSPGMPDAAVVGEVDGSLAIATDSFVVSPLFFPGGDIGSLSVFGTVNDLAVAGAKPQWLTFSLILEEGLSLETLDQILRSVAAAATRCAVKIVAGDTKVVPRGAVDSVFINTSGVGILGASPPVGPSGITESDVLIVSGPIGKHGISVMAARENLGFSPPPESDSAPLHEITHALTEQLGAGLIAMRDATRGGVGAVLHEWAGECGQTMRLQESQIPVSGDVRGACELLGIDPLQVANEGTLVAAVRPESADAALDILRSFPAASEAALVGRVTERMNSPVVIERLLGTLLPLDEPSGAPLPRIC